MVGIHCLEFHPDAELKNSGIQDSAYLVCIESEPGINRQGGGIVGDIVTVHQQCDLRGGSEPEGLF